MRCVGDVANGAQLDTSTPGPHDFTVAATDTAGNTTTQVVSYTVSLGACVPAFDGITAWLPGDRSTEELVTGTQAIWTGPDAYVDGRVGQGFSVGTGRSISLPFQQAGPFTLQAWVQTPDRLQPESSGILSTGTTNEAATSLQLELDGNGNYQWNVGDRQLAVLIGPATGAFQHLAMTYDGSTIATYLNGQLVETDLWIGSPGLGFHILNVGIDRDGIRSFNGAVDEVEVFGRALSAAEIYQTFLTGAAGFCKDQAPVAIPAASPNPAEATGPGGATVTLDGAQSSDPDSDPLSYTWREGSTALGAGRTLSVPLSIGSHTITLTVDDGRRKSSSSGVTVVVRDTTPPSLSGVPSGMFLEATGSQGATATWSPVAIDIVDNIVDVVCAPASGRMFPVGTTTVSCSSTDAHGNTASATFDIVVRDTTAPTLSGVPANIIAEATSAAGAVVTWPSPVAVDTVDGSLTVTCVTPSGTTFPLGASNVSCSATDIHGNSASAGFIVTVRDTTGPHLTLPTRVIAEATSPLGAAVSFTATATDVVSGAAPVTCAPASGSGFAIGSTSVSCFATDWTGNVATDAFNVVVVDTTAPAVRITSPSPDALLSGSTMDVVLEASDAIGVTAVTVNGVAATMIGGTQQSSTWRATVPILLPVAPGGVVRADARAFDVAGNVGIGSLLVDNDGIPSVMDRSSPEGPDLSDRYSNAFDNGATAGTLARGGWTMRLSNAPSIGGVRAAISGSGTVAKISACVGPAKEVKLDAVGETADVTCDRTTGTITVKAISASPQIELREQLVNGLWQQFNLRTGQSVSVGSPATASAQNVGSVEVYLLRIDDDGRETIVGSYQLDPNASVDVSALQATPGEDRVRFNVLRGNVPVRVGALRRTLKPGQEETLPIRPLQRND
jgi:hypothetical protein